MTDDQILERAVFISAYIIVLGFISVMVMGGGGDYIIEYIFIVGMWMITIYIFMENNKFIYGYN
jgi:hypothetical protein